MCFRFLKIILTVTFIYTGLVSDVFNNDLEDCTPANITANSNSSKDPTDIIKAISESLSRCNDVDSLLFANEALDNLIKNANKTKLFDYGARTKGEDARINIFIDIFDKILKASKQYDYEISTKSLDNFIRVVHEYATRQDVENDLLELGSYTHIIQRANIILMVIDPHRSNITGLAIHRKKLRKPEKNFHDFILHTLSGNENPLDIIDTRFETGVNIPYKVMEQLTSTMTKIRIVFSIFYKDSWFLEETDNDADGIVKVKSKTISVSIPQKPDVILPDGVFTIFKREKNFRNRFVTVPDGCSNWIIANESTNGKWNRTFYEYENLAENLLSCSVKQTTISGYVQLLGNDKVILSCDTQAHDKFINVISIVMCSLSIVCIVIMFVLAEKIITWRLSDTTPLILHLAAADGLQMLFFILIVELKLFDSKTSETFSSVYCFFSGAILHYLTLVGFFLSLFATDHLIRTYVIGTPKPIPINFQTKVLAVGWLLPLLLVGLAVSADLYSDSEIYLPTDILLEQSSVCYPAGDFLMLSVHIPIIIAIVLHLIIFIWIIVRTNQKQENLITNITRIKEKCGTYLYAFSLLSITWLSAIVVYYTNSCWIRVIFSYIFVTTATSRGWLMFISCVVLDGKVRRYFKRIYRNYHY